MALEITCIVICDYCLSTQASLANKDEPLPVGWMRVQGYANIFSGVSCNIRADFCEVCVGANTKKDLVKKAADVSLDLT